MDIIQQLRHQNAVEATFNIIDGDGAYRISACLVAKAGGTHHATVEEILQKLEVAMPQQTARAITDYLTMVKQITGSSMVGIVLGKKCSVYAVTSDLERIDDFDKVPATILAMLRRDMPYKAPASLDF